MKPTKEFEDLCKVGRTGEIDQQEINAYLVSLFCIFFEIFLTFFF